MKDKNKFIKEYNMLLNKDIYITKSMIDELFYKYSDTFLYVFDNITNDIKNIIINNNKIIDNHNDDFINNKLIKYKDYFDTMFSNIDKNINLDIDQRKIVLEDDDNTLVIAGAGSGKTTTMSAKVKYLVDKNNINPKEIMIISFTNQATLELVERINKQFKIDAEILTFHKLGMKIIKKSSKKNYKIVTDNEIDSVIENYLLDYAFKDKNRLKKIMNNFKEYLNFTNKIYDYNNFNDYYLNYIKILYYKNIYHIEMYNKDKINQNLKILKNIEGTIYSRFEHVLISNYLYQNNFKYCYEQNNFKVYDETLNEYKNKLQSLKKIKINSNNNYLKNIIVIIKKVKENKKIRNELNNLLNVDKRTNKDIFFTLMLNSKQEMYQDFITLIKTFIMKYKNKYTIDDFDNIIDSQKDSKLKEQLIIIKDIYNYYESYKKINNKIDFFDMIELAYQNIDKINFNYKYLIIDEYQDISFQRYKLIKKIKDTFNTKILAVGDDFQAIFSFSGSEINLFTDFYNLMGFASIKKITKTYRNSQELIDIAGNFVMKNKEQFKKELISNKHINNPIEIIYYYNNKIDVLNEIIEKILKEKKDSKILLLGRYKNDIYTIIDNKNFKIKNQKVKCLKLQIDIDFLTIHAAKGLGYDNVILINFDNKKLGFPSQIEDDLIIKTLSNNNNYFEERRLFYVALTRTKNKIYIMTPKDEEKRSIFHKEIDNSK